MRWNMWSKKKRGTTTEPAKLTEYQKRQNIRANMQQDFKAVMDTYYSFSKWLPTTDKIALLEFMVELIRQEWKHQTIAALFHPVNELSTFSPQDRFGIQFPTSCVQNNRIVWETCKDPIGIKEVDFSKDCVITFPWAERRLFKIVPTVYREGFRYHKSNHSGCYFPNLKIGIVGCGFHSTAAGIIRQQGTLPMKVYDDTAALDFLSTDGLYWYIRETGEPALSADWRNGSNFPTHAEVYDAHLAEIFSLVQIQRDLTSKIQKQIKISF